MFQKAGEGAGQTWEQDCAAQTFLYVFFLKHVNTLPQ